MMSMRTLKLIASAALLLTLSACDGSATLEDAEQTPQSQPNSVTELSTDTDTELSELFPAAATPATAQIYDIASIDASHFQDPNQPENAIDGNLDNDSRWSAQGRSDAWLALDLGTPRVINTLAIEFLNGDERSTCFHIQTSHNGSSWITQRPDVVSNGKKNFSFPETVARYIRYVGLGNSVNDWNSIIEIEARWNPVTGNEDTSSGNTNVCSVEPTKTTQAVAQTYPVFAVDASDYQAPNVPSNVIDGSTDNGSRWSAQGRNNVWLEVDLGSSRLINTLDILFLKHNERNSCFNIQTSTNGRNWTTQRSNVVSNGERSFSIQETNARYVRYVGLGNSSNAWNTIIELDVQWLPLTGNEDISNGNSSACPDEVTSTPPDPTTPVTPPKNSPTEPANYAIFAVDASDYQDPNFPENVADELTEDNSRWSAQGRSGVWLELDLGSAHPINALDLFFLKSDERNTCFSIQTSNNGSNWTTKRSNIVSNGERIFSIPETSARYIRYVGLGNSDNNWNSIIEANVLYVPATGNEDLSDGNATNNNCPDEITGGSNSGSSTPINEENDGTFNPGNPDNNNSPTDNFDLTYWKITYPDASEAYPPAVSRNEFYTDTDTGAMVFECVNRGEQTSSSTKYARSELREMLRGSNTSIGTKELGNNWVTSAASSSNQNKAGGVDGNMKATVAVDRVSTTYSDGNDFMLGRVIVGQIHGSENEPFKIYYRKLPGNSKGSIYFSYEDSKIENYYELFGSRDTDASNPGDGIALGEKWSYEVNVSGRQMKVTVTKEDGTSKSKTITWSSEYDDDWFYFKAGNYNQNNGGDSDDYARVSFFSLDASHN